MKKLFPLILFFCYGFVSIVFAQPNGQKIFVDKCTACHTIGQGKRVGPDLIQVNQRRDIDWLVKFVQSSQRLINSGDSLAIAIFEENNKVLMPDQPLNRNEVLAVIDYISINSPDPDDPNVKTPIEIFDPTAVTAVEFERGKNLFMGKANFQNRGASCISCHNVTTPGLQNGGLLAKDLTNAFSRLSAAGVDGVLRNLPFPAMLSTYDAKPLTDQEVKDLLAFMYFTDMQGQNQLASNTGEITLLVIVVFIINIVVLMLLLYWRRVKKYSVNSLR